MTHECNLKIPCSLVNRYAYFSGTCSLHVQDRTHRCYLSTKLHDVTLKMIVVVLILAAVGTSHPKFSSLMFSYYYYYYCPLQILFFYSPYIVDI